MMAEFARSSFSRAERHTADRGDVRTTLENDRTESATKTAGLRLSNQLPVVVADDERRPTTPTHTAWTRS